MELHYILDSIMYSSMFYCCKLLFRGIEDYRFHNVLYSINIKGQTSFRARDSKLAKTFYYGTTRPQYSHHQLLGLNIR